MQAHPYLMFNGNARQAFARYAAILGGTVSASMSYGEAPENGDQTPAAYKDWIMHTCLNFGDQLLMGSDHAPFCPGPGYEGIKGCSVSLQIADPQDAARLFTALSENAIQVQMPFGPTFWAQGFGMCVDQFGVPWMVNCPAPDGQAGCEKE